MRVLSSRKSTAGCRETVYSYHTFNRLGSVDTAFKFIHLLAHLSGDGIDGGVYFDRVQLPPGHSIQFNPYIASLLAGERLRAIVFHPLSSSNYLPPPVNEVMAATRLLRFRQLAAECRDGGFHGLLEWIGMTAEEAERLEFRSIHVQLTDFWPNRTHLERIAYVGLHSHTKQSANPFICSSSSTT